MQQSADSRQQSFWLILMLGILNTITPITIDMYLPAFPQIAGDLHTTVANVSLSVSTYFLGFALGQILYGPLLDRFGRKPPLYIGLILYIAATLSCAASASIEMLLTLRFIQALSGCVASVAAITFVQDLFPPERSASIISLLILVVGLSPLLAPTIGSFIVSKFSWHYIFITLASITAIVLIFIFFFLPNGAQPDKTVSLKPKPIINTFKSILLEPQFYVFALAGTFSFSGLFIYVAGSPDVFMNHFHLTAKQYGGVFALLSVGFIGGSQLNHLLTKKYTNKQIFKIVLIVQLIAAALFAVGVINGWLVLATFLVFLFIILMCAGISYPNAAAIALAPFSKNAGSASALLGFLQIGISGGLSSIVGFIHTSGSVSLAVSMAISSAFAFSIYFFGQRQIACSNLANV